MNDFELSGDKPGPNLSMILLITVVFGGVVLWFAASYVRESNNRQLVSVENAIKKKKAEDFEKDQRRSIEETVRRDALANGRKANWERFAAKCKELKKELATAELENTKRLTSEKMLLDTPSGRFLMEDDRERAVFTGLQEKFGPATGQLEQWVISATSYETSASQMNALSLPETEVPIEDFSKITSFTDNARKLTTELVAANVYLTELVAKGEKLASKSDASASQNAESLREGLAALEAKRVAQNAVERQKMLVDLRESEESKTRELLKTQEQKRLEKERELLAIQFDLEMKAKDHEVEKAKIDAARKSQDLLAKNLAAEQDKAMAADLEQIESMLAPFIAKAKTEFTTLGFVNIIDESKPISLSALQGYGAMEQSEIGYGKLQESVRALTAKNQRPMGSFSTDQFDKMPAAEAQRLLRLHGAAMIRAGMLSK